jgi:hypothetical protein
MGSELSGTVLPPAATRTPAPPWPAGGGVAARGQRGAVWGGAAAAPRPPLERLRWARCRNPAVRCPGGARTRDVGRHIEAAAERHLELVLGGPNVRTLDALGGDRAACDGVADGEQPARGRAGGSGAGRGEGLGPRHRAPGWLAGGQGGGGPAPPPPRRRRPSAARGGATCLRVPHLEAPAGAVRHASASRARPARAMRPAGRRSTAGGGWDAARMKAIGVKNRSSGSRGVFDG